MISRYEVILNDIALSSINPNICVLDVNYTAPKKSISTYNVAKRNGSRIHSERTEPISVSVSFEIHSYNIAERQHICGLVSRWAKNGGILEINDRPGQRLRCICEVKPVIESAKKWTDPVTMTFVAYQLPYWEEKEYAVLSLTAGTSGSGTLFVPGCEDGAMVEADITVNASTLTSLMLTANGKTMTLSGLSVGSGNTIKVAYDDQLIQSIKVGSTSILDKRTGADDLIAKCGEVNSFSFTSNKSVTVKFKVRGLWT